jgi:hypothetical protein
VVGVKRLQWQIAPGFLVGVPHHRRGRALGASRFLQLVGFVVVDAVSIAS